MKSVCRLQKLCGVTKAPLKLLGTVQCAPHSFGVDSPSLIGGSASRQLHREAAMMPPTASQRRPAVGVAHRVSLRDRLCRAFAGQKIASSLSSHCLMNTTFRCRMCSSSNTPSHPISVPYRRNKYPVCNLENTPSHPISSRVAESGVVGAVGLCRCVIV